MAVVFCTATHMGDTNVIRPGVEPDGSADSHGEGGGQDGEQEQGSLRESIRGHAEAQRQVGERRSNGLDL
jgi:hypothetical protein